MRATIGSQAKWELRNAVVDFCDEHSSDLDCATYDFDGDGIPDRWDNCRKVWNRYTKYGIDLNATLSESEVK